MSDKIKLIYKKIELKTDPRLQTRTRVIEPATFTKTPRRTVNSELTREDLFTRVKIQIPGLSLFH